VILSYKTFDFGEKQEKFEINGTHFEIFFSEEREKINPFGSQFPVVLKQHKNNILISVKPDFDIVNLKSLLSNEINNLDIFCRTKQILTTIYNCKMLNTNLYLFMTSSNIICNRHFKKLSNLELRKLTDISNLSAQNLIHLNEKRNIFILKFHNEIKSFGLITRENEEYV
jgi:hypothetical protein